MKIHWVAAIFMVLFSFAVACGGSDEGTNALRTQVAALQTEGAHTAAPMKESPTSSPMSAPAATPTPERALEDRWAAVEMAPVLGRLATAGFPPASAKAAVEGCGDTADCNAKFVAFRIALLPYRPILAQAIVDLQRSTGPTARTENLRQLILDQYGIRLEAIDLYIRGLGPPLNVADIAQADLKWNEAASKLGGIISAMEPLAR